MTLQDLMSGTFTVSGSGTFQADNVYMQRAVTLSCVNAFFKLVIDDVQYDLDNIVANFDFDLSGQTITRVKINCSCDVAYGNYTKFIGSFGA